MYESIHGFNQLNQKFTDRISVDLKPPRESQLGCGVAQQSRLEKPSLSLGIVSLVWPHYRDQETLLISPALTINTYAHTHTHTHTPTAHTHGVSEVERRRRGKSYCQ